MIESLGLAGPEEGPGTSPSSGPSTSPDRDASEFLLDSRPDLGQIRPQPRRVAGPMDRHGSGGVLGFLGGVVIFLAFLYYMLANRTEWIERITRASRRPRVGASLGRIGPIQSEIVTYISYLAMVSLVYMVVISLAAWAIGLPQPLLWGVLTALLEVIPYFGPLIAGALPTVVSLTTGAGMWQPLTVIGLFAALQTFEGYVITPIALRQGGEHRPGHRPARRPLLRLALGAARPRRRDADDDPPPRTARHHPRYPRARRPGRRREP